MLLKSPMRYHAEFDRDHYLQRTKRNHFWLGGVEQQMRLRNLTIGVAGLGGMGSHIAEHLVRLGVGHIKIADNDIIEASNLNRQAIAHRSTLGLSKVEASVRELRGIATDFVLEAFPEGITEANADAFVDGCDLIVNEIDVFPLHAHVTLNRAARKKGIALYTAMAVGMGIHFYKFQGDEYTFEDFIDVPESEYLKPTAHLILDRFGQPLPSYINEKANAGFLAEIATGGAPILGPTTLLGHSTVVMRILIDIFGETLAKKWQLKNPIQETPIMPHFLVLDVADLTLKVATMRPYLQDEQSVRKAG